MQRASGASSTAISRWPDLSSWQKVVRDAKACATGASSRTVLRALRAYSPLSGCHGDRRQPAEELHRDRRRCRVVPLAQRSHSPGKRGQLHHTRISGRGGLRPRSFTWRAGRVSRSPCVVPRRRRRSGFHHCGVRHDGSPQPADSGGRHEQSQLGRFPAFPGNRLGPRERARNEAWRREISRRRACVWRRRRTHHPSWPISALRSKQRSRAASRPASTSKSTCLRSHRKSSC